MVPGIIGDGGCQQKRFGRAYDAVICMHVDMYDVDMNSGEKVSVRLLGRERTRVEWQALVGAGRSREGRLRLVIQ